MVVMMIPTTLDLKLKIICSVHVSIITRPRQAIFPNHLIETFGVKMVRGSGCLNNKKENKLKGTVIRVIYGLLLKCFVRGFVNQKKTGKRKTKSYVASQRLRSLLVS